ncbi:hypothetical protein HDU96_005913 [Phlyctochytrium bullatum]|nr:hypothetical protein HDU96_005913 [Phlyctochytrium bullatum]
MEHVAITTWAKLTINLVPLTASGSNHLHRHYRSLRQRMFILSVVVLVILVPVFSVRSIYYRRDNPMIYNVSFLIYCSLMIPWFISFAVTVYSFGTALCGILEECVHDLQKLYAMSSANLDNTDPTTTFKADSTTFGTHSFPPSPLRSTTSVDLRSTHSMTGAATVPPSPAAAFPPPPGPASLLPPHRNSIASAASREAAVQTRAYDMMRIEGTLAVAAKVRIVKYGIVADKLGFTVSFIAILMYGLATLRSSTDRVAGGSLAYMSFYLSNFVVVPWATLLVWICLLGS